MQDSIYMILKTEIWYRCRILLVWFVMGTVINAVYLFRLKTQFKKNQSGRRRQRVQDYEKRKRKCIVQYILGLTVIVILFFAWVLLPLQDVLGN